MCTFASSTMANTLLFGQQGRRRQTVYDAEARWWSRLSRLIAAVSLITVLGCSDRLPMKSPSEGQKTELQEIDYFKAKLHDPRFVWTGPTSREDRIPVLHAARALAYIGDAAVTALLDAVDDPDVDIYSLQDALVEIGLPVSKFDRDLRERQSAGLRAWWRENASETRASRSRHRVSIGLPPLP